MLKTTVSEGLRTSEPPADARIFALLRSGSALDRSVAAAELTDLLEEKHSTEHHRRVGELIASPDARQRAAGLAAIGALLRIDGEDLGPRLSTYATPLRMALVRSIRRDEQACARAADFYGALVRRCRDPDVLEAEVKCALDALRLDGDPSEQRRPGSSRGGGGGGGGGATSGGGGAITPEARVLVSVLSLRQITVHAPTAVYPHVNAALDLLWRPLAFPAAQVRFAATDALYALLVLVAPRAARFSQSIHMSLFAGAAVAIERESSDRASSHGGLLALSCLVRVATSEFVLREDNLPSRHGALGSAPSAASMHKVPTQQQHYNSAGLHQRLPSRSVFAFAWAAASRHLLQRRNHELTRTALRLVIDLVRIAPAVFAAHCLPDCVRLVSDMLRDQRCKLRAEAFVTHAAIVRSLGASYLRPHVAVLLASLREALIRGSRSRLFCEEALASLTAIALEFGEEVALQLQPLLRPTLQLPLSHALLHALHAIAISIPSLARGLRENVLNTMTTVLARGSTWAQMVASAGNFADVVLHEGAPTTFSCLLASGPGGALIGLPVAFSPSTSPAGSPNASPGASPSMLRRDVSSGAAPDSAAAALWLNRMGGCITPAVDSGAMGGGSDCNGEEPVACVSLPPSLSHPDPFGACRRVGNSDDCLHLPASTCAAEILASPPQAASTPFLFGIGGGTGTELLSPRALPRHVLAGSTAHRDAWVDFKALQTESPKALSPLSKPTSPAPGSRALSVAFGCYATTPTLPPYMTEHHGQTPSWKAAGLAIANEVSGGPSPNTLACVEHLDQSCFGSSSSSSPVGLSSWPAPFAKSLMSDPREMSRLGLLLSPSGNCLITAHATLFIAHDVLVRCEGDSGGGQDLAPPPVDSKDTELALALSAFSTYVPREEQGRVLVFLDHVISPLLFHAASAVRLEAALVTTKLLAPTMRLPMATDGRQGLLASHVLSQMVSLCIGDPDEAIRLRVLEELDGRFLNALADPIILRPLAATLHDALLAVRLRGVILIGSLAAHNPATANPLMRKLLMTLLAQLRSPNESMHGAIARRVHHESATLLTAIEHHAPRLARAYCVQILHALLPLLRKDAPPVTAAAATYTLAELLTIAGPMLELHAGTLLTLFLAGMKHRGAPGRRRAALAALERLFSCRGPAIIDPSPYERSAALFPALMAMLATEQDELTRNSAVRVLGLLGALEPLQYRAAAIRAAATADLASQHPAMEANATTTAGNVGGGMTVVVAEAAAGEAAESKAAPAAMREQTDSTEATTEAKNPLDDAHEAADGKRRAQRSETRRWGDDLSPSSPQYLPTIALRELMAILHDASLSAYHHRLIAALVYIFTALGDTCAPLLPRVMPTLLAILMQSPSTLKPEGTGSKVSEAPLSVSVSSLSRPATTQVFNHLMQQLPALVSAMHGHLQPWVPQLLQLVRVHWHGPLLLQVITLLEQLTLLLRQALTPHTGEIVPLLAAVIEADNSAQRVLSLRALNALDGFGPLLSEYSSLLLPAILRLLSQAGDGSSSQEQALGAIQRISAHVGLARAANSLVPLLLSILRRQPQLCLQIVGLLTTLMITCGRAWRVHERATRRAFDDAGLPHGLEALAMSRGGSGSTKGESVPVSTVDSSELRRSLAEYRWLLPLALQGCQTDLLAFRHFNGLRHKRTTVSAQPQPTRLPIKQQTMRRMWESPQLQLDRAVEDDWLEWMRHLSVEMLRESPSPALRACAPVAQMHGPLARRLFNVAFLACWGVLEATSRESLVAAIEQALTGLTAPAEVLQELLALAEYMERHDCQLPLNLRMLGDIASRCGSYSKALHYRELEQNLTSASSSPRLVEALVSLHRSLGQPEAAIGVLTHAQQRQHFKVKLSWLERLGTRGARQRGG